MIELLNKDCMEFIESVEDNSIDAIITDPPYGVSYQSARRTDKTKWKPKIENDEIPYTEWIKPCFKKLKIGGRLICFYRWDVQDYFLDEIAEAGFIVKSQIVWDKIIHGMGDLKGEFAPQHELMIFATKDRYEFHGKRPKTIYRHNRVDAERLVHPNEKPIDLMAALIRDITVKGELVFDPFGGSFATACAAWKEKRGCISTELSPHYFNIGVTRYEQIKAQLQLF